jgi:chemotaxis signal transduction protein
MALNAAHVCEIGVTRKTSSASSAASGSEAGTGQSAAKSGNADAAVQKLVTFRIAKEEFAFHMEHVREILRVQTPNQVPDVPDYVLGVLTVRGQILPVIDLRRLLQQRSLADEFVDSCRAPRGVRALDRSKPKSLRRRLRKPSVDEVAENLRKWLTETNSSSQLLMEALAKARGLNEKVIKQLQVRTKHEERGDRDAARACADEVLSGGREAVAALQRFEQQIAQNIQEDQRIIVVDAEGFVLGLVVDHVHEVLNVPKSLMEPPPRIHRAVGWNCPGSPNWTTVPA